jgi:aryl-alcohol dehydrogenase-like predicted oxidoreductase
MPSSDNVLFSGKTSVLISSLAYFEKKVLPSETSGSFQKRLQSGGKRGAGQCNVTRQFGKSYRFVSALGLGGAALNDCYGRSNSDEQAVATVRRALELGVDYFDTSAGYGQSEYRLGLALEGANRNALFLATKCGTGPQARGYTRDATLRSVEESLRLLRTGYIDLMQIHDPPDIGLPLARGAMLDTLAQLRLEGVIGAIGIGVRSHEFLLRAMQTGMVNSILTYMDFNLLRQTARDALFDQAADLGVAVIIGSPLMAGLLTNEPVEEVASRLGLPPNTKEVETTRRLDTWCRERGITRLELALQYILRDPRVTVVLTGMRTPQEAEENVAAVNCRLPSVIWQELTRDFGIR